jgi:2'-5' RNA ligase
MVLASFVQKPFYKLSLISKLRYFALGFTLKKFTFMLCYGMRFFLGLEIPWLVKKQIYECLSPLHKSAKGWEQLNDYHLTLLYLGEVGPAELSSLKGQMEQFQYSPFNLITSNLATFDHRILYLSCKFSPELIELERLVRNHFSHWVGTGGKAFTPHVTVKRCQGHEYRVLQQQDVPPQYFMVSRLSLFKSQKDSLNNKYHVIYQKEFI